LFAALRRESYDSVYAGRTDNELDRLAKVRQGDVPGIPNDENMVRELEDADDGEADELSLVRIIHADGRQETRSKAFLSVADYAVSRLEQANNSIRGFVES